MFGSYKDTTYNVSRRQVVDGAHFTPSYPGHRAPVQECVLSRGGVQLVYHAAAEEVVLPGVRVVEEVSVTWTHLPHHNFLGTENIGTFEFTIDTPYYVTENNDKLN